MLRVKICVRTLWMFSSLFNLQLEAVPLLLVIRYWHKSSLVKLFRNLLAMGYHHTQFYNADSLQKFYGHLCTTGVNSDELQKQFQGFAETQLTISNSSCHSWKEVTVDL